MGSRGKKRVRANGEVASSRLPKKPTVPPSVPAVTADEVQGGVIFLRRTFELAGKPQAGTSFWNEAYGVAQSGLRRIHGRLLGDAVLWRATFLDALLGWDEFQERHRDEGELPTPEMLEVAAIIATRGDDTSFDNELFEELLAEV